MNIPLSPYHRPWLWLLRETSVIALLGLAAWAVVAPGLASITQLLAFIVLAVLIVVFTMRLVADIFAAAFCRWSVAMGAGLAVLVESIREARRKR